MNKILVIGGAGYIGSHVTAELLKKHHKVVVYDNFMYQQPSLAHLICNPNLEIVFGDIRDISKLKNVIKEVDLIIHLAAIVGAPACNAHPKSSQEVNVESLKSLVNLLSNDQALIFPSTNSVYGKGIEGRVCSEDDSLNPLSTYAKQKIQAEKIVFDHPSTVCLRFATAFGVSTRMRLDLLINNFVFQAQTIGQINIYEGDYKRNFIHVNDAALSILYCISKYDFLKNNIFNIGISNQNLSKTEICQIIQTYIPKFKINFTAGMSDPDQRNYMISTAKSESHGFINSRSIKDGIIELIKAHPLFLNGQFTNA